MSFGKVIHLTLTILKYPYLPKLVIPNPKKSKLAFKIVNCMFIGYAQNSTTYRFFVLKIVANLFDKNNIIKSEDAKFFEDFFSMKFIVERSLPHVKGFSDPPNLRRYCDDPPNSGRCFDYPFKTRRYFSDPLKIGRYSSAPLKSFEHELRRSKRKE